LARIVEEVSSAIHAKNQALNENIDKVMIIPDLNLGHPTFCVESRFCFGAVDYLGTDEG
jgi:hypothetical protein